jgi:hypothetical protein
MLLLKILAFCAGCFVAFAAPFLMLSERQGLASGGLLTVIAAALAVLLFALTYFFFAFIGHRIGRSPRTRRLATLLVAFQLASGAWLLFAARNPDVLLAAAPLLSLSVLLFLGFIWPGDSARTHRPMRRRDQLDELQPR